MLQQEVKIAIFMTQTTGLILKDWHTVVSLFQIFVYWPKNLLLLKYGYIPQWYEVEETGIKSFIYISYIFSWTNARKILWWFIFQTGLTLSKQCMLCTFLSHPLPNALKPNACSIHHLLSQLLTYSSSCSLSWVRVNKHFYEQILSQMSNSIKSLL